MELALFGSVLRDDFRSESDVDMLVNFEPGTTYAIRDLVRMESELTQVGGRTVDLVERRSVEENPNYIRRSHILRSLEPVYVAR